MCTSTVYTVYSLETLVQIYYILIPESGPRDLYTRLALALDLVV